MGNRFVLSGLSGPVEGLQWETTAGLCIGRTHKVDVTVNHPSISRQHAEVCLGGHAWCVRDLGSANGTFVNGARLSEAPRRLQLHDTIQCGDLAFQVTTLELAALPTAPANGPIDIKTTGEVVRVQAFAQRSWEQALEDLVDTNHHLERGSHFLTLIRAGHHLSRIHSLPKLLQALLDDIVSVLDAQCGAIALVDENTRELQLRTVATRHGGPARSYSNTLAQRCFNKGESLLCADAASLEELQSPSVDHGPLASVICAVLRSPRCRLGILHLDRGPRQEPFSQADFLLVDAIAANISVGIESAQGLEKQRDQFLLEATALAHITLDTRDAELGRHSKRVADFAALLADELKLSEQDRQCLQAGALFHDIGKIGIPDAILHKSGRLTPAEAAQLRSHPVCGAAIAQTISCLEPVVPVIRHHHERWDGAGYPDGLAGDNIPRLARVVAVANAIDHATRDPVFRSPDEVLQNLRDESGGQFDPECIAALFRAQEGLVGFFTNSMVPSGDFRGPAH